jgi:hypothetical protein
MMGCWLPLWAASQLVKQLAKSKLINENVGGQGGIGA